MKRFAVIGLGRFGEKLAIALSMSGAEVIAIDKDRMIIEDIRDQVTQAVRLDSTDEDALKAQGIDKVDVAIVGMGERGRAFESAILTVVNLKAMGVPQIYARAADLTSGQVFSAVGATDVVYPEIEHCTGAIKDSPPPSSSGRPRKPPRKRGFRASRSRSASTSTSRSDHRLPARSNRLGISVAEAPSIAAKLITGCL